MDQATERISSSSSPWSGHLPGLTALRNYRREWLPGDLVAGVSVCLVMIPAAIAYASLMGLRPQHGLYAAISSLVVYALFGSSRHVIVGPDIAISLLIASTIGPLTGSNSGHAASLASALGLLTGLLLLLGARAKFGAVADFLSKPVLVGYMTGAALILMASQLGAFFGLKLQSNDFVPRLIEFAKDLDQVNIPTMALGGGLFALLIVMRRLTPRLPSALIVCIVAIIVSWVFRLEKRGLAVVGDFPSGLPAFALPDVSWKEIQQLVPAAIGIALLTYTEGILLARAFAARNGYEVSANQELNALGFADLAAGLLKGFSVTGSQARTAINEASGGKTQLSGFVAAVTLAVFLIFLTPAIAPVPKVALAVLLLYAGCGLVEFRVMARIYRFYPRSAMVAALTTLSVLLAGVVPGILFGGALSLLGWIHRISNPPDGVLEAVSGHGFHDLGNANQARTVPGLLAYRFYAPLLFCNVGHFIERVRQLVAASPKPLRWFLLDAQAITDIDVTAVEALHSLNEELRKQGIALKIAHANRPFRQLLDRTGLAEEVGASSFFSSVHECVESFSKKERVEWSGVEWGGGHTKEMKEQSTE